MIAWLLGLFSDYAIGTNEARSTFAMASNRLSD